MASKPTVFAPLGGMNQDDGFFNPTGQSASPFQEGSFRYALNVRTGSTRDENEGDAEVLRSSLEVSGYRVWNGSAWVSGSRPNGNNIPLNHLEDRQLKKIFIVFYNATGEHTICEYRSQEQLTYELLKWTGLNFQQKYVSLARVSDYLILTDKINRPRIINFRTIHTLRSTLGNKFTEYHVSFSKWAPVAPPFPIYNPSFSTINTKIKDLLLQFTYRYQYVGGFYSAWSPVSQAVSNLYLNGTIAEVLLSIPGLIHNSVATDLPNSHDDSEFYEVVQFIEIAYRGNQKDAWKIFQKWPVTKTPTPGLPGANNVIFSFDGKFVGIPIANSIISQDYDEVPIKSGCTEVIDNRVLFGNNLDEHTYIDDVDFIENVTIYQAPLGAPPPFDPDWLSITATSFSGMTLSEGELLAGRNQIAKQTFKGGSTVKFGLEFKDETGKKSLIYTTDNWVATFPRVDPGTINFFEPYFAVGWNFKSTFKPPEWATNYQILRTNALNIEYFMFGVINKFTYLAEDTYSIQDTQTNPEQVQSVIREYFDQGKADFSLASRLGSQFRKTKEIATLTDASRIYLNINNWYNGANANGSDKDFPLNKLFYQFREGDYVRFYGSTTASPSAGQITIFDLPIVEFTGRGIIVERPAELLWLPTNADNDNYLKVEVYRPKSVITDSDLIFYEIGEWYPITNPGESTRNFLKRDWRWNGAGNVSATLYRQHYAFQNLPVSAGDCHLIVKDFYYDYSNATWDGQLASQVVTSMNPNKDLIAGEWERNAGRPNIAYSTKPLVEFKDSQVRFGGKFFQDSLYNNLNNFRPGDLYLYPQEYGGITEMVNTTSYQVESVGSILLVLGSVKPWSVYVNRTTLEDLGGRTQFFLSEKVLGSYNSLLRDHGCLNPESISFSDNGNVYWWSQDNGAWIRYGRDGTTAISEEYKMNTWFKQLAELLDPYYTEETQPWVVSIFDSFHGELMTYISQAGLPATFRGYDAYKGMVFSEKKNQWKFAHSYQPDLFLKMKNQVFAFGSNKLWLLEAGADYTVLMGIAQPAKIEPVINTEERASKTWQNITLIASHKWSIERTLSEYSGIRAQQQSLLLLDKFQEKESALYSEFMTDQNSGSDPDVAAADGNILRSRILRLLLKLDPEVRVKSFLHQVVVDYLYSEKTAK